MTELLEDARQTGRPPFAGQTFYTTGEIVWPAFIEASRRILDYFEPTVSSGNLLRCDDWHCHDGFITNPESIAWSEIHAALRNPAALRKIASSDHEVYCSVYPKSHHFLWRICLEPEEDWPSSGEAILSFDISGAEEDIQRLRQGLSGIGGMPFAIEASRAFFDSCYGG